MKSKNIQLINEIAQTREQLHNCIERYGIADNPQLTYINSRLDELILRWIKACC
jgi:hypothetical protein